MYVEVKSAKMKCSVFPTKHLLGVCQQNKVCSELFLSALGKNYRSSEKNPPDRDVGKFVGKCFICVLVNFQ